MKRLYKIGMVSMLWLCALTGGAFASGEQQDKDNQRPPDKKVKVIEKKEKNDKGNKNGNENKNGDDKNKRNGPP